MKKILSILGIFVFCLSLVVMNSTTITAGEFCFLCGSGSSCQQCKSASGKDSQKDRKICEQRGCKVSGTTSCSTAANVKVCR